MLIGVTGTVFSNMTWKKERVDLINSVRAAVENGEYDNAISLAQPYHSRNDPDLNALVDKAMDMKQKASERARREEIANLIEDIKAAQGEERRAKLEKLLLLAPNTNEFAEDIKSIKKEIRQREEMARAEAEKVRLADAERKELEREEQIRLAREAKLAEFKWKYIVENDDLTSKPVYLAVVQSINQVSFDFPYRGPQRGKLILRTHPQHGKELILKVDKGQMLVQSYEDSIVKVVFDEGSPISYRVVGPADHGTTSLFFRDYQGFVARMLKARTLKVSVPFYQEGNVVFEFDVSGFNADKYLENK